MEYFEEIQDRVILIGVQADRGDDMEESLDELGELAATAGAAVAGRIIQNREAVHPGTYIGKGKIEEVKGLLYALDANGVICDDELSPAQMNNLERELECKVMDRTLLILDIFAKRAVTSEGKIQVELAQLRYRSARLVGLRSSLSRLGGGIGTRGPGEKKLETDRRLIRNRISALKQELSQVEKHRELIRSRRAVGNLKTAAIVGYTNAGKSTLLNQLTNAGIPANNRLFDTLDTTSRQLTVSDNLDVILSDTVGFISKLPHHLVNAFHATLEELEYADLLLHVIDASDPNLEKHVAVVDRLIAQLAKPGTPVLKCYNKADLVYSEDIPKGKDIVAISAKRGKNMDGLLKAIEETLGHSRHHVILRFPYDKGGMVETLHDNAQVKKVEYTEAGIEVETVLDPILYGRLAQYIVKEC